MPKIKNIRTINKILKPDQGGWFEYQGKAILIGFRHGKDANGYDRKQLAIGTDEIKVYVLSVAKR